MLTEQAPFAHDVLDNFEMNLQAQGLADGKAFVDAVIAEQHAFGTSGNIKAFVVPVKHIEFAALSKPVSCFFKLGG